MAVRSDGAALAQARALRDSTGLSLLRLRNHRSTSGMVRRAGSPPPATSPRQPRRTQSQVCPTRRLMSWFGTDIPGSAGKRGVRCRLSVELTVLDFAIGAGGAGTGRRAPADPARRCGHGTLGRGIARSS